MNWQRKYFETLEQQLMEIKDELKRSEDRKIDAVRDAMQKIYMLNDQRQREYLSVNDRMHEVLNFIDKKQSDQNKWVYRVAIAVILGISSLVCTGVFGFTKLADLMKV
ncbi:MAG: hypothetical protein ACOY46_19135 [Bacillota bacterium]